MTVDYNSQAGEYTATLEMQNTSGWWHYYEMPWIAGSRPKLFICQNGGAFLIYQSVRDPIALGYNLYFIDGDLTICAASAQSNWTDWQIIHVEPGLFLNEMLGDPYRFEQEQVLSVMVQQSPTYAGPVRKDVISNGAGQSTPLRIIVFFLD